MSDAIRNSIDYLVTDIERIHREMGEARTIGIQAEDREAFEILRRIERRLRGKRAAMPHGEAVE